MTTFTCLAVTILPRGWLWGKQPSRKHFASVQMPAKHTLHELCIFIADTSITMALWLNWKLHAGACQIIPGYSRRWVGSKGVRDSGKNPPEIWSEQLSSTRATLTCSTALDLVTEWSGVM